MIRNSLIILVVAQMLPVFAGCSKEYEHRKLGRDSPQAKQVRKMVQLLHEGGLERLDELMARQAAADLTGGQTRVLRGAMERIVDADTVELEKIERFGKNVYRAVFRLDGKNRSATLAVLLVTAKAGTLRWAGPN
ncbi:MAG: hypothetical protein QF577_04480 [Phycisphaerae bacterium]|jgi:hypothetical protein|nr:hypothetical protein [Phycisphaerae bacterium]